MDNQQQKNNQSPDKVTVASKQRRFTFSKKASVLWVILALGLAGVGVLIYILLFQKHNSVVFVIDGREYHQSEVKSLTKYRVETEDSSLDEAATSLYEALKTIEAAKKVKLDISDEQVQAQKTQLYQNRNVSDQDRKQYDKWFTILARQSAIHAMFADRDTEGYIFDFYFGQHIQYGSGYKPDGQGKASLIAKDQQYAKERAEYYHAQLSSGAMSPDAVLQEVLADPKLGNDNNSTSNHSMHFKTSEEDVWQSQIYSSDTISFIQKQTTIDTPSKIQTIKGKVSPNTVEEVDIKYYFVYMKSLVNVPITSDEFSQALDSLHAEYKGYQS